jgi:ABC-type dipeptide/oligopeptide/nickel transport system ATPase subunit
VKKAEVALKNIVGLDAFVNKEQWNVIWMKEEYHAKFATILQIIHQRKMLAYFSNRITITLNLTNKGKKINRCSIMLTQMLIKLT